MNLIKKPIFIIGCPRSGTTILLDLLSSHEDLGWISLQYNLLPRLHFINFYNRIYSLPLLGRKLFMIKGNYNKKGINLLLPQPMEPWIFWETYLSNFRWRRFGKIQPRRRNKDDITINEIEKINKIIGLVLKYQNKKRFLSKYTDLPRIIYLLQAFPDAKFIHLLRDGRAVSNSLLNKMKTGEFGNWNEREWWIKGWPKSWRDEWKNKYNSPISLAAYLWKFFLNEIWEDSKYISSNQYIEISYKNLVENKYKIMNKIIKFCELEPSKSLDECLHNNTLKNMNYKWKENLNDNQKKELEEIIYEEKYMILLENK